MRRKLLLLNAVLALLAIYAGWLWSRDWRAAKAREAATLNVRVKPAPPPPFTPLPAAPPVVPSGYSDVVQKTLFDRSRNPVVEVVLPPAPPPPPPKPMPALPVYYGIMNLGDGPMAVLAETAGDSQQAIHPGESIGQFKLVSVNTEEIAFEWDGQTIRKRLDQLSARAAAAPQAAAPGQNVMPAGSPAVPTGPAAPAATAKPMGPGADAGGGYRSCQPNDSTPAGSVVDGFRKTVANTPFGQSCTWVSVSPGQ